MSCHIMSLTVAMYVWPLLTGLESKTFFQLLTVDTGLFVTTSWTSIVISRMFYLTPTQCHGLVWTDKGKCHHMAILYTSFTIWQVMYIEIYFHSGAYSLRNWWAFKPFSFWHSHTHFSTIAAASFRSHFHLKIPSQDVTDICESFLDYSAVPYVDPLRIEG
jgi:hypothetical protein